MDEKLNTDATGMRLAGVTGRGDATTQLAASVQFLLESFPDCDRRFDWLGWLYGLGLLVFFNLFHGLRRFDFFSRCCLWFKSETFAEPAGDFIDYLGQLLNAR